MLVFFFCILIKGCGEGHNQWSMAFHKSEETFRITMGKRDTVACIKKEKKFTRNTDDDDDIFLN